MLKNTLYTEKISHYSMTQPSIHLTLDTCGMIPHEEMMEDTKITIIEGPPPTFENVYDIWANGILETPSQMSVAVTRLRTSNGHALVERCHRAWRHHEAIQLEYRTSDGETEEVPIVAARTTETQEGQILFLWVQLPLEDMVFDIVMDDDEEGDEGEDESDDMDDLDDEIPF